MKKNDQITVQEGSGNVFADLDLPHSEQDQIKAELTLQIYRIIKKRNLTQAEAGEILGIKQPHVSVLMRNRSGHFLSGDCWNSSPRWDKMLKSTSSLLTESIRTGCLSVLVH